MVFFLHANARHSKPIVASRCRHAANYKLDIAFDLFNIFLYVIARKVRKCPLSPFVTSNVVLSCLVRMADILARLVQTCTSHGTPSLVLSGGPGRWQASTPAAHGTRCYQPGPSYRQTGDKCQDGVWRHECQPCHQGIAWGAFAPVPYCTGDFCHLWTHVFRPQEAKELHAQHHDSWGKIASTAACCCTVINHTQTPSKVRR